MDDDIESSQWEQKRRRNGLIRVIIIILAIAAAAAIVMRNNLFQGAKSTAAKEVRDVSRDTADNKVPALKQEQEQKPGKIKAPKEIAFAMDGCKCRLADEGELSMEIKLELHFSGTALKSELKEKAGELCTLLQSVTINIHSAELTADMIRGAFLERTNGFLKAGKINDVTFTGFKIQNTELPAQK